VLVLLLLLRAGATAFGCFRYCGGRYDIKIISTSHDSILVFFA